MFLYSKFVCPVAGCIVFGGGTANATDAGTYAPASDRCQLKQTRCANYFGGYVRARPYIGRSMTDTTPSATLYARTLHLVRTAPRTISYAQMGEQCGRTRAWVSKFAKGEAEDASIRAVQCLHDFLSNVGNG